MGTVLQGKHDIYDTDLMRALIEASANASGVEPDVTLRISVTRCSLSPGLMRSGL